MLVVLLLLVLVLVLVLLVVLDVLVFTPTETTRKRIFNDCTQLGKQVRT